MYLKTICTVCFNLKVDRILSDFPVSYFLFWIKFDLCNLMQLFSPKRKLTTCILFGVECNLGIRTGCVFTAEQSVELRLELFLKCSTACLVEPQTLSGKIFTTSVPSAF